MNNSSAKLPFPLLHIINLFILTAAVVFSSACSPVLSNQETYSLAEQPALVQVQEYPIVEQSKDNPNHISFQDRAQKAVATQQPDWFTPSHQESLAEPNRLLANYGYQLRINSTPPFSTYSLYYEDQRIEEDIQQFDPVIAHQSSAQDPTSADPYILMYETVQGQRKQVSFHGIDSLAKPFSSTEADAWIPAVSHPVNRFKEKKDDSVLSSYFFGNQIVTFYTQNGLTRIQFGEQELPNFYDQVVINSVAENKIFDPGIKGKYFWFYALRDGLWYYVEAKLS
jgi:hypothetical protein